MLYYMRMGKNIYRTRNNSFFVKKFFNDFYFNALIDFRIRFDNRPFYSLIKSQIFLKQDPMTSSISKTF